MMTKMTSTTRPKTDEPTGIVVGGSGRSRFRRWWVLAAFALVLLGVVAASIWLLRPAPDAGRRTTPANETTARQSVDRAIAAKDFDEAAKLQAQQGTATPEDKLKLASIQYNKKDYAAALRLYEEAEQADGLTASYTIVAADTAVKAGDKAKAIALYGRAKQRLLQERSPVAEDDTQIIDAKIAELQK